MAVHTRCGRNSELRFHNHVASCIVPLRSTTSQPPGPKYYNISSHIMLEGISQPATSKISNNRHPTYRPDDIHNPAIFKLNQDLIWRIFSFNTKDDLEGIITLKHTSQVCSSWRELSLSSSSLWGRVVNIDILRFAHDDWTKEVIRRTGQAWLYVTNRGSGEFGLLGKPPEKQERCRLAEKNILEYLFKNHWTRIKSLHIHGIKLDFSKEPAFEALLQQRAPFLEVFRICILSINTNFRLFVNDAPSLRACQLSHIAFNPQAPWLSQIRHFHGCNSYSPSKPWREHSITPNQLLNALAGTPLLETLHKLDEHTLGWLDDEAPLPNIILPRLTDIALSSHRRDNTRACVALLHHITPASGCALLCDIRHKRQLRDRRVITWTAEKIAAIQAVFSRYSENYFKIHSIPNLLIRIQKFAGRRFLAIRVEAGDFKFRFLDVGVQSPSFFVKSFFNELNLRNFISLLDGMEVLDTSDFMLPLILNLRNDEEPAILPLLRRLILVTTTVTDVVDPSSIFSFLQWRREIGLPMDGIYLPLSRHRTALEDFSSLEEFVGLEVKWGHGSYTCGGGDPGQLIFPISTFTLSTS